MRLRYKKLLEDISAAGEPTHGEPSTEKLSGYINGSIFLPDKAIAILKDALYSQKIQKVKEKK